MTYEELLEKARETYESEDTPHVVKAWLLANIIYPTDKSEDEKNIKDLIDELKCSLRAANCQNDTCGGGHEKRIALLEWGIAWLEKQDKKTLDPDKVIAWLVANIRDYEYFVEWFKKDFGL